MRIRVIGAAGGEVTGSAYFVQTKRANVLVECGMFQGGRAGSADPHLAGRLGAGHHG